jgi:hypothetical protein
MNAAAESSPIPEAVPRTIILVSIRIDGTLCIQLLANSDVEEAAVRKKLDAIRPELELVEATAIGRW